MNLNFIAAADGSPITALGLPPGGGTVRVDNTGATACFVTGDGSVINLTAGGYPTPGFVGYVVPAGYIASIRVEPAIPSATPTLRVRHLTTGGSMNVRVTSGGADAPDPKLWAFAQLTPSTVTGVSLDGVLGRITGAVEAYTIAGAYSLSGDDVTPDAVGTGCVLVDGTETPTIVNVTRLVSGVPTPRAYSTGAAVVALSAH